MSIKYDVRVARFRAATGRFVSRASGLKSSIARPQYNESKKRILSGGHGGSFKITDIYPPVEGIEIDSDFDDLNDYFDDFLDEYDDISDDEDEKTE